MKQMVGNTRFFAFTGDHTLVLHLAIERAVGLHLDLVADLIPNQDLDHQQIKSTAYLYTVTFTEATDFLYTLVVVTAGTEAEAIAERGNT